MEIPKHVEEIIRLRGAGLKYREISEKLGVSMKTIRKWLNRFGLTKKTNAIRKFDESKISEREKGWIVGLVLGDGNMYIRKSGCREVYVYLNAKKDIDILERYSRLLGRTNLRYRIVDYSKKRNYNKIKVEVSHKGYYNWLKGVIKKLGNSSDFSKEFLIGVVEGLIDSDGNVYENGRIRISTTSEEIKEILVDILEKLDVLYHIIVEGNRPGNRKDIYRIEFRSDLFLESVKYQRVLEKRRQNSPRGGI